MSSEVNTNAYLDSLSTLSKRGFSSIHGAMDAILQLVAEQLLMRSAFFVRLLIETNQLEIVAVHNLPGGCAIQRRFLAPAAGCFINAFKTGEPTPHLLEDVRREVDAHVDPLLLAFPSIRCCIAVPIVLADGMFFGSLCAVDPLQLRLSQLQAKLLVVLARLLATQIEREQQLTERRWVETELSRALTALQKAEEQREYMNKVQDDFVSIVNHEFRTTLTGIQGFSELMRDEEFSFDEIKEYAADINADARRLNQMITEILNLDQMKNGEMKLRLEPVNLNMIITMVIDHARLTVSNRAFHLQLDEQAPSVMADRDKLIQVLTHLVGNAIKYSYDGTTVTVSSKFEADCVHVCVQDQGTGIPISALERIFEPYSRVNPGATRYIKGAGLGLSTVREIIRLHGGATWAESELNQGAALHFTIPLFTPVSEE